jgi:hypothetical protein
MRRLGVLSLLVSLASCGARDLDEVEEMPKIEPWHMWGSTQDLHPDTTAGVGANITQQVANIQYKRPETWRFFFKVEVVTITPGPPTGDTYQVLFNVTFGVGRTNTRVPGFALFNLPPASLVNGFTSQVSSVEFPAENATRVSPNVIDRLVAQSIQVEAVGRFTATGAGVIAPQSLIQATAFFAPDTHIRPEWFKVMERGSPEQFPGGEDVGR